jgi:heat-inducible transcriptional repressor
VSEIEQVMERAAQVLSYTTHHISMVLKPQLRKSQIRRIQIVRITEKKAILLVVTSAGLVKDTMITIPDGTSPDCLEMISNMLTDKLTGKTLEEAEQDLTSCIRDHAQANAKFVADVLQVIENSVEPQGERGIVLSGTQNIIDYPEYMSIDKAKSLVSLLETKEMLYDMMKKATQLEFSITIGTENEAQELYDMSVVTATYKIGGRALGSFGVIGPTRMDYAKIASILGFVGNSLDSILSNFIETDE